MICMENIKFDYLKDIADWQLDPNKENVDLPELQRGFVWKPNQIESLWDSLLRGFPIGSFLLSQDGEGKLSILDGQQRATSIALGYYNPWQISEVKPPFWSLKKVPIPVLWLDLLPKEKPTTQKFILRLVTQSHPWGYQAVNNSSILTLSDRRKALEIFREEDENKNIGYTQFSLKDVFPYDSTLPVPLAFLTSLVKSDNWKDNLLKLCEEYLPHNFIHTKHLEGNYINKLRAYIENDKSAETIFQAIKNLDGIKIPSIITNEEVLESEDEQTGKDPTLFVRLNSSGTPIAGEDLIYSIYKATFPNSKELVEKVGLGFIAPSHIISLATRLVLSDMNNKYPYHISINEFRKKLKDTEFKQKLETFIGNNNFSPIAVLFQKVLDVFQVKVFQSEDNFNIPIPPVLVKNLIKSSSELLLMTLQWLKLRESIELTDVEKEKILAVFTALSWFGRDNTGFVNEIWGSLASDNVWSKQTLNRLFYINNWYIMYPLVQPDYLRKFLLEHVAQKNVSWDNLYTKPEDKLNEQYKSFIEENIKEENEKQNRIDDIWCSFIEKLIHNRSMLLFVQRKHINDKFKDFNQLENLEDTNTPWDWDHIYPASWVYNKRNVNVNVRRWTYSIGNIRAISLEDNRSENNRESPSERLTDVKKESFIKENDWEYWKEITGPIKDNQNEKIKDYLSAVINRLCNIYEEWYNSLKIGDFFS